MKTKFKKATAILLSFVMTFSIFFTFSATVNAETFTSGDYTYVEYDNGTAVIIDYIGSDIDIVIPNNIDNSEVIGIGNYAFEKCNTIETIVIPDGVISIGNYAFDSCTNLRSITLSNGVESIGNYAFDSCTNLQYITLPDSVKSIGERAFRSCDSLESIKIPYGVETIEIELFSCCKNLSEVIIPDSVKKISHYSFASCSNLQNVNIPDSVEKIVATAFYNCKNLTSIRIPNSVTEIYQYTFGYYKNEKIENFTIIGYKNSAAETYAKNNEFNFVEICPNENMVTQVVKPTCTEYGYTIYTCKDCGDTYLADFTPALNHNYEVISETDATCASTGAIKYKCRVCGYEYTKTLPKPPHTYEESIQDGKLTLTCTDCGHLYPLGEGTERIKSGDYHYTILSDGTIEIIRYVGTDNKVVIPNTIDGRKVISIGDFAFSSSDKIDSIVIPDGVRKIGRYSLASLTSLTSVIIPESVQTIGDRAFYNCTKLSSIVIPDGVTSIEEYAFNQCKALESITISNSVTSIGEMAFGNCWKLKNVRIPKSVTNIGGHAFGFHGEYYDENDVVSYKKISNFTIHGFKGTAAEKYANFHGFSFVQTSCTHNNMTTQVVEPKCTEAGYTRYTCNDCGYTYKADYTDALGHKDEVISKTDSTCTSTGKIEYKCKVCGYKHTKITPTIPHTYKETIIEPSCSKEGQKIFTCTGCGDTYSEVIQKSSHTYEDKVIVEPSCTQEGQKICRCTKCGDTYTEVIPTLSHSFVDTVIEPTACTDGYTLHKCSICGYEYTDEIVHVDNPVHNFKDGICTVCGTNDIDFCQSEHNYSPNTDKTWTISRDGAFELNITFSDETETEEMFDYIYIYDSDDNLVGEYTGTMLAGKNVTVKGDTAKIRLVTDGLNSDFYGFSLTYITAIYKEHIKGDVNGDGEVTVADATDIQKNIADILKFNEKQMAVADINGDGDISIADVTILQKYIAGLIDTI